MSLKILIPAVIGGSILFLVIFLLSRKLAITIVLSAVGVSMVWKTTWWLDLFGRVPWAEEHLTGGFGAGMGGSWAWYKLLGILVIVAAILYLTGGLQTLLVGVLGPFFGATAE